MKINLIIIKQTINHLNQEIEILKVQAPLGTSDHATITVELKAEIKRKYNIENELDYCKADYKSIESRN